MASNPNKAAAKAEYIKRRKKGKKINLRVFAEEIGVRYDTLRRWRTQENWDNAPTNKGGAPKGNKNAKGHGAPAGNKNAEKDGAYSAVLFDKLTERERQLANLAPMDAMAALQNEMRILKIREARVLDALAKYEQEDEETLHLSSLMDMREPEGGQDGAAQTMGMYSSDTAFARREKLNEALYKIQGRIIAVINAIRAIDEANNSQELERERLDIMRMRATGIVELEEGGEDEAIHK